MRHSSARIAGIVAAATVGVSCLVTVAPSARASFAIHEYPLPTPQAGPYGATLGADGNVWFTDSANQIGKITPAGTVTVYTVPTANTALEGITAGPDGNLWFVETGANKIGRITTSGTITEFPIPTANSGATMIAAGPDGKLWFTEYGTGSIGRVTTSGVFSSISLPTPGSGPVGITSGSDGNVWVVESLASAIARITPSGTVTEFPLGAGRVPYAIAPGSDGNIWFTESMNGYIGKMSTSGTLLGAFGLIPSSPATPFGIAPGPDGNMWATEYDGNSVAQITPSGTVTESIVPTPNSTPFGITPGSDGNMWFAEFGGDIGDNIATIGLPHLAIHYISYIPNRFFVPNITKAVNQGDTVSWLMLDPGTHGIADSSGMGLFGFSPFGGASAIGIGQVASFAFDWAGGYSYDDPFHTAAKGTVQVPVVVKPVVGAVGLAQVTWASGDAPAGFGFDVQVRQPGSTDYVTWQSGVATLNGVFGSSDPLWVGPGRYAFRARLRQLTTGAASGYSPVASISIT